MVKVEVGRSSAKFEAELDELLKIVELLKGRLRKKHRRVLKDLLEEIDKLYIGIVKAIDAFYAIPVADPKFNESFATYLQIFKEQHNSDLTDIQYNSDYIKRKLDELLKPKRRYLILIKFLNRKPTEKAIEELKSRIDAFYAIDYEIYHSLLNLQTGLNNELDRINHILREKGPNDASSKLNHFLEQSDNKFKEIKELRSRLIRVKDEL